MTKSDFRLHMSRKPLCLTPAFILVLNLVWLLVASATAAALVSELSVVSEQPYAIVPYGLRNGAQVYIDSSHSFASVPLELQGATLIRTAQADQFSDHSSRLLQFTVREPVTVFVLVPIDDYRWRRPKWLESFAETGKSVLVTSGSSSMVELHVFARDVAAGTVTLGGNHNDEEVRAYNMYSVALLEQELRVLDLTVASGRRYEVVQGLDDGVRPYIDRDYTYTNVPVTLRRATLITTANNDKFSPAAVPFLRFTTTTPVRVSIIFDTGYQVLPTWLHDFRAGGGLKVVESQGSQGAYSLRRIYEKDFPAGEITLGGNLPDGILANLSMYTVAIQMRPLSSRWRYGEVVLDPTRAPETRLLFRDGGGGGQWAIIGPYKAELEQLARQRSTNKVRLRGLPGPFLPGGSTLAVTAYNILNAWDGVLENGAGACEISEWLEIRRSANLGLGCQPPNFWLRDSNDSYVLSLAQLPAYAVGCKLWATTWIAEPDGCSSMAGECGPYGWGLVDHWGLLRCGADPMALPWVQRPGGDEVLQCAFDSPDTRWYCQLDTQRSVQARVPKTHSQMGVTFPIGEVLSVLTEDPWHSPTALTPQLRFTLNWSDGPACRGQNNLGTSPIQVVVGGEQVGLVYPGYRLYAFDLTASGGAALWQVHDAGDALDLTVHFTFAPTYAQLVPGTSYLESMPAACGLVLSNVAIGFDPAEVHQELEFLGGYAAALIDLLAAQTVIHGQLLDATQGALCAVDRIATAVQQTAQWLVREPVAFVDLPRIAPQSYFAIIAALNAARAGGGLPADPTSPWDYFLGHQPEFKQACLTTGIDGAPSEAVFQHYSDPTREQGIANAQAYTATRAALEELQTVGWAIVVLGGLAEGSYGNEWLSLSF